MLGPKCDNQPNIWECGRRGKEELAQGGDRGKGEMTKCVLGWGWGLGRLSLKTVGRISPWASSQFWGNYEDRQALPTQSRHPRPGLEPRVGQKVVTVFGSNDPRA